MSLWSMRALGRGAGDYRIDASTRAGRITLRGVRHDPAAEHIIRLDTTGGDVTVTAL